MMFRKNAVRLRTMTIFLVGFFVAGITKAQSIPVDPEGLDDYYRRQQLLGQVDSAVSFTIRPLFPYNTFKSSSLIHPYSLKTDSEADSITHSRGEILTRILPVSFQGVLNTHHPYGWNDGALIPAKGLQALISGGIFASYGPLTVQMKPELVIARNLPFRGFPTDDNEVLWWSRYYDYYNYTDLPERFGGNSYTRLFFGQSSIRLNLKQFSFGISSENLWWGPGIHNSLLMSNTATGFKHLTFNTTQPIKTPIGSFEGQLIAGRLEGSGYTPLYPDPLYFGNPIVYLPKPDDWRYLSGLTATWQPEWVPGLFLGFASSSQIYSKDLDKLGDYMPPLFPFQKVKTDMPINKKDKFNSVFFRWLWPEEQAEIYFEFGRNNPAGNLRDLVTEPENSRAYIFGLQKMLPFGKRPDENLQIGLEVTQLQQTSIEQVRKAEGSWYVSKYIRHGYTNRGEPLGAGIGPGANMQSLDISWVKGVKKIGIQLDRYVHNNDYYYYAFEPSLDWRRHWVDLSMGANSTWDYGHFIFNAKFEAIQSYNYKWYLKQDLAGPYVVNGIDAFNIRAQVGFSYRF